jgi:hypothetical protein
LRLYLRDPFELDLLFLYQNIQQLATFIQKVDQFIELVAAHVHAATLADTRDAPMRLYRHAGKDCTFETGQTQACETGNYGKERPGLGARYFDITGARFGSGIRLDAG